MASNSDRKSRRTQRERAYLSTEISRMTTQERAEFIDPFELLLQPDEAGELADYDPETF